VLAVSDVEHLRVRNLEFRTGVLRLVVASLMAGLGQRTPFNFPMLCPVARRGGTPATGMGFTAMRFFGWPLAGLAMYVGTSAVAAQTSPVRMSGSPSGTLAPPTATADTVPADTLGAIGGRVVAPDGTPVDGADVLIIGTARRARSGADGRFLVSGIPPGEVELLVRKLGFAPAGGALFVMPGRRFDLEVRLPALTTLRTVTVKTQLLNEIRGVITDSTGTTLAGVQVTLAGQRRMTTGPDGAFVFANVEPGRWMLRMGKRGYEARVVGVRMVAQLERSLAVTLRRANPADDLFVSDSVAWFEHERRRSWMGGASGSELVTRDQLAPWGDAALDFALRAAAPQAMAIMGATVGNATGRGPTSFGGGRAAGGISTGGMCILLDGLTPLWNQGLHTFSTSQVESVEIFPPNSDQTRTGCSRFPISSNCGCGVSNAIPGYYVVWTRR
jgi:hypothetical protein